MYMGFVHTFGEWKPHVDRSVSALSRMERMDDGYVHGNVLQDRVVQYGKGVGKKCREGVDEGNGKVHVDSINLDRDERNIATHEWKEGADTREGLRRYW